MASFDEPLPTLAFPHELNELYLYIGVNPMSIAVRVGGQNGKAILDTTLYPEMDGYVTLYDLADLIRDNCEPHSINAVYFGLDDHSESVDVIPSRIDLAEIAEVFATEHFLTLLDGVKPTYIGAVEYLPFYFPRVLNKPTVPAPSITCLWVNPDTGETREAAGSHRSLSINSQVLYTLYFLPSDFKQPAEGFILHSFRVELGSRRQDYILQTPLDAEPFSLKFYNNFGLLETFHFFGTTEKELKPTRSTASFNGKTRNYRVEAVPTWKCDTGALPASVQPLFADLCAATQVWRQDTGSEVTITDNEYKISNDRYALQTASLTFRETARTAAHVKTSAPKRTFDSSFDETFY